MSFTLQNMTPGQSIKFAMVFESQFWLREKFSAVIACLQGSQVNKECSGFPLTFTFDSTDSDEGGEAVISGIIGNLDPLLFEEMVSFSNS